MSTMKEAEFAADPIASLRAAREAGELLIEAEDGSQFALTFKRATSAKRSPLDVGTVPGLHLSVDDIVDAIRAGHERR